MKKDNNKLILYAVCIVVCIIYVHGSSIVKNGILQLKNESSDGEFGDYPALLCVVSSEIRKLDLASNEYTVVREKITLGKAIDYDYAKNSVVWSASYYNEIYSASLGNEEPSITLVGNVSSQSVAIDWIHNNVYWSDRFTKTIGVVKLNGQYLKTLHSERLGNPQGIVLNPLEGWMFWINLGNIERSGLDGTHREVIISRNITWPLNIAIDLIPRRIYWVESSTNTLGSADYDGSNQRIILKIDFRENFVFSLDVFEDWLYWNEHDISSNDVYKANKLTGGNISEIVIGEGWTSIMRFRVYHSSKQPQGINRCGDNNGGCSHFCLPAPDFPEGSSNYTCACPDGAILSNDGITCLSTGPCFPNPCQNGGTCKIEETDYSCTCKMPFSGKYCEIDPCSSSPCRNGGSCSLDGNNYKCYCKKPHSGRQCENDCDCGTNSISCKLYDSRVIACVCKPGYAQRNETCSVPCNGHSDCLNGGICRIESREYFCQCRSTFSGDKCETDVCETLRSKCDAMRAACKRVGDTGVCECELDKVYNYQYNVCEEICGSRTCIYGKCVISENTHRCICDEGFSGSRCNQRIIKYSVSIGPMIVLIILCTAIVAFTVATICIICRIKKLKKTNSRDFLTE